MASAPADTALTPDLAVTPLDLDLPSSHNANAAVIMRVLPSHHKASSSSSSLVTQKRRKDARGVTDTSAIINFVNGMLGTGLLAFPYCFRECGALLASSLVVVAFGLVATSVAFIIAVAFKFITSAQNNSSSTAHKVISYESIAREYLGHPGAILVSLAIVVMQLGTLVAYVNVLSDVLSGVAGSVIPPSAEPTRAQISTLVVLLFLMPVTLAVRRADNISGLSKFSVTLALLFVCFTAYRATVVMLVETVTAPTESAATDVTSAKLRMWSPDGTSHSFPVFLLGFMAHTLLWSIYEQILGGTAGTANAAAVTTSTTAGSAAAASPSAAANALEAANAAVSTSSAISSSSTLGITANSITAANSAASTSKPPPSETAAAAAAAASSTSTSIIALRRLTNVAARTLCICLAVYLVCGLSGYYVFRDGTSGDLLRNLGESDAHVLAAARIEPLLTSRSAAPSFSSSLNPDVKTATSKSARTSDNTGSPWWDAKGSLHIYLTTVQVLPLERVLKVAYGACVVGGVPMMMMPLLAALRYPLMALVDSMPRPGSTRREIMLSKPRNLLTSIAEAFTTIVLYAWVGGALACHALQRVIPFTKCDSRKSKSIEDDAARKSRFIDTALSMFILTCALFVAIKLPNVEFVLGLIGTSAGCILAFVLPGLLFFLATSDDGPNDACALFVSSLMIAPASDHDGAIETDAKTTPEADLLSTSMDLGGRCGGNRGRRMRRNPSASDTWPNGTSENREKLPAAVSSRNASKLPSYLIRRAALCLVVFGIVLSITGTRAIVSQIEEETEIVEMSVQLAKKTELLQEAKLTAKSLADGAKSVMLVQEAANELESVRNETMATMERVANATKQLDESGIVKSEFDGKMVEHGTATEKRGGDVVAEATAAADATLQSLMSWDGHSHVGAGVPGEEKTDRAATGPAPEDSAEQKIQSDVSDAAASALVSLTRAEDALSKLDEARRLFKKHSGTGDEQDDDSVSASPPPLPVDGEDSSEGVEPKEERDVDAKDTNALDSISKPSSESSTTASVAAFLESQGPIKNATIAEKVGSSAETEAIDMIDKIEETGDDAEKKDEKPSEEGEFPLENAVSGLEAAREAMRKSAQALSQAEQALSDAIQEAGDEQQHSVEDLIHEREREKHAWAGEGILEALGFEHKHEEQLKQASAGSPSSSSLALEEHGANKTKTALSDAMSNLEKAFTEVNSTYEAAKVAAKESEEDAKQKFSDIKKQYAEYSGAKNETAGEAENKAQSSDVSEDSVVPAPFVSLGRKGDAGASAASAVQVTPHDVEASAEVSDVVNALEPSADGANETAPAVQPPPGVPIQMEAAALADEIAADLEESKSKVRAEDPKKATRAEALAEALVKQMGDGATAQRRRRVLL